MRRLRLEYYCGAYRHQDDSMLNPRKELKHRINLHENILRCLLNYGKISIADFRELTIYQFSSNEVSAVLKGLKKIGLVTYEGRFWYLNEKLIKSMGLLSLPDLLNYVVTTR